MILNKDLVFYHGSYAKVENIDLDKSASGKDFGKGFYVTTDLKQAKKFVKASVAKALRNGTITGKQNYGFVSVYKLTGNFVDIPYYEFKDTSREWLWTIASNRRKDLALKLEEKINEDIKKAEIISGKVANDQTNPVILNYVTGAMGPVDDENVMKAVIMLLLPDRLQDQYCFKTDRAIACLKYEKSIRYEF